MDIQDYRDRLKESKVRRPKKYPSKPKQFVTKIVAATDDWKTERVNEYCETILTDGGISEFMYTKKNSERPINIIKFPYCNTTFRGTTFSLNKQKRWDLCRILEKEMKDQVNSRDNWAPHISVVERSIQPDNWRCDVSRAMFTRLNEEGISATNPENESSEREYIEKLPKSWYSTTTDLLGYSDKKKGGKKEQKKFQAMEHPEVMYEFACDDGFLPKKNTPQRFVRRGPNEPRIKKKRCVEIVDYDNDFEREEDDSELTELYKDEYILDPEMDSPRNEISLETLISRSQANKRQRKGGRKDRKQECVTVKSKKGKVINVPREEFIMVDEPSKKHKSSMKFKLEKSKMESFYSANQTESTNGVLFGNIRPVLFAADLTINEDMKSSEYCYLLFETDFNPDTCDDETLQSEHTSVQISTSLVCKNQDFVNLFDSRFLKLFSGDNTTVLVNLRIENLITDARTFVAEKLRENPNCCCFGNTFVPQRVSENPCLREGKSRRMMKVIRDINKQIGVKMESVFPQTLIPEDFEISDEKTMHDVEEEFVLVNHSRISENCQRCGVNFEKESVPGMALETCRHWFCRNCWSSHALNLKQPRTYCIKADCQEEANFVTQMLCNTFVDEHYVKVTDDKNGSVFRCKDKNCVGVTKIFPTSEHQKFVAPTMLTCDCGVTWCAKCNNDAHGPVSCHVAQGCADEFDPLHQNSKYQVSGKCCPTCRRFILKESGCKLMTCICGELFCWKCLYPRQYGLYHACVEPAPEKMYTLTNRFAIESEIAERNQRELQKHRKASCIFGYQARVRVMMFLSGTKEKNVSDAKLSEQFGYHVNGKTVSKNQQNKEATKHELLSAVEDLLLVKDEMHYMIPYIHAAFTHGNVRRSARKLLQNLNGKMETLTSTIEYTLLTRNYYPSDLHSSAMFRAKAEQGRRMIKSVFNAFLQPCR